MKLLSAKQIKTLDAATIANEPISSLDLMERAAQKFTDWLLPNLSINTKVFVICGSGNNGGDGLAVARMLLSHNFDVQIFIVPHKQLSDDARANLERLKNTNEKAINFLNANESIDFGNAGAAVIIDALFGAGLDRPVKGYLAELIQNMNESKWPIIAIDLPSGLGVDQPIESIKVQANYTFSFELPKLSFLLPENAKLVGDWTYQSIGLDALTLSMLPTPYYYTELADARKTIRRRPKFSHKGTNGRAILLAGSKGSMGAAVLAGKACVAAGAGLVTLQIPHIGMNIVQTSLPEAMVLLDEEESFLSTNFDYSNYQVLGIGPGIGQQLATQNLLHSILTNYHGYLVIDADAINMLAADTELKSLLHNKCILTPHPKEFERLAGTWENDYHRLKKLQEFAQSHQCTVVLKGAHTAIALHTGEAYFNSSGNAALGTGGAGDVLTGIITSLLAQGYTPKESAVLGVFVHGLSADIHQIETPNERMTASEIIVELRVAFALLLDKDTSSK